MASVESTLLRWFNSIAPPGRSFSNIHEIADEDNATLCEIVSEITSSEVSGNPPEHLEKWLAESEGKHFVIDKSDPESIGTAALGASVLSAQKDSYIHKMMDLSQDYQTSLMMLIEEFNRTVETDEAVQLRALLKRKERENKALMKASSGNAYALESQSPRKASNSESEELVMLQEKVKDADRKNKELLLRMEELEEDLSRMQSEKDKLLKSSSDRASQLEEQLREQSDDLELARSRSVQLVKAEAKIEKLLQRLEELPQLRSEIQELREENSNISNRRMEHEAEMKQLVALKQQVETYKNKAYDLESELVQAREDVKSMTETNEELKQLHKMSVEREKIATSKYEAAEEEIERMAELGSSTTKTFSTLEQQVNEAQPKASPRSPRLSVDKIEHERSLERQKSLEEENELLQQQLAKAKADLRAGHATANENLIEQLKEKEANLMRLEGEREKLQAYVKKALKSTTEKNSSTMKRLEDELALTKNQLQNCKALLKEREDLYQREQRLIMSAFYETGLETQRRLISSNSKQPESWLAKQRKESI